MRAALPLGAVGDAPSALHDEIAAILMGALALATDALGQRGVVGSSAVVLLAAVALRILRLRDG